jgi:hypothetical protein
MGKANTMYVRLKIRRYLQLCYYCVSSTDYLQLSQIPRNPDVKWLFEI